MGPLTGSRSADDSTAARVNDTTYARIRPYPIDDVRRHLTLKVMSLIVTHDHANSNLMHLYGSYPRPQQIHQRFIRPVTWLGNLVTGTINRGVHIPARL